LGGVPLGHRFVQKKEVHKIKRGGRRLAKEGGGEAKKTE